MEKHFVILFAALLNQIQNSTRSSKLLFPTSLALTDIGKSRVRSRKLIVAQEDSFRNSSVGRRKYRTITGLSKRSPQKCVQLQNYTFENVRTNQSISGDIIDESTLTGSVPSRNLKSKWPEMNVPQMTGRNCEETLELSPTLHGAEVAGMHTEEFQGSDAFIFKVNQNLGNFIVKMFK